MPTLPVANPSLSAIRRTGRLLAPPSTANEFGPSGPAAAAVVAHLGQEVAHQHGALCGAERSAQPARKCGGWKFAKHSMVAGRETAQMPKPETGGYLGHSCLGLR